MRLNSIRAYFRGPARSAGIAIVTAGIAASTFPAIASADSTDDYPVPRRMLKTTCTAEQYLAAVRDYDPIYYTRYIIDKNNKPQQVQDATIDRIHQFFAKDYAGRREESEVFAVNYPPEALTSQWPNWGKIFFNNKGVVAKGTENCSKYPSDMSVWDGP